jgi:hypothetical protein
MPVLAAGPGNRLAEKLQQRIRRLLPSVAAIPHYGAVAAVPVPIQLLECAMRPPADNPPGGGYPMPPWHFIYPSKNPYIFIPAVLMHFDAAANSENRWSHIKPISI